MRPPTATAATTTTQLATASLGTVKQTVAASGTIEPAKQTTASFTSGRHRHVGRRRGRRPRAHGPGAGDDRRQRPAGCRGPRRGERRGGAGPGRQRLDHGGPRLRQGAAGQRPQPARRRGGRPRRGDPAGHDARHRRDRRCGRGRLDRFRVGWVRGSRSSRRWHGGHGSRRRHRHHDHVVEHRHPGRRHVELGRRGRGVECRPRPAQEGVAGDDHADREHRERVRHGSQRRGGGVVVLVGHRHLPRGHRRDRHSAGAARRHHRDRRDHREAADRRAHGAHPGGAHHGWCDDRAAQHRRQGHHGPGHRRRGLRHLDGHHRGPLGG